MDLSDGGIPLYSDTLKSILADAVLSRIPLSATLELTRRCNFSCRYCYQQNLRDLHELCTEDWIEIMSQMRHAGCKFVILTGGEPLLRQDFYQIYEAAFKMGLLVRIKTNGSLISDDHISLWKRLRPANISVSLYGASESTYSTFCGTTSAYDDVANALQKLKDHGLPVTTTYVAAKHNVTDVYAIHALVSQMGIPFHCYANIVTCDDGSKAPLSESISIEEQAEIHEWFYSKVDATDWRAVNATLWEGDIRKCYAGSTAFRVTPTGEMNLCPMAPTPSFSILHGTFLDGWEALREARREIIEVDTKCSACDYRTTCGMCAPNIRLRANGRLEPPDWYCKDRKTFHKLTGQVGTTK